MSTTISTTDLVALAKNIANQHQLFPHIIAGICEKESSWNPWANRYEPAFYTHYVEPEFETGRITISEAKNRATSWGLCQVMGQSARELEYADWLTMLCDPATGLEWGCRLFAHKLSLTNGNITQALSIYNGGKDVSYAPSVLALATKYQQGAP